MTSSAAADIRIPGTPEQVFPLLTRLAPSDFYPRFGPLPAVVRVLDQSGPWDAPGQTRRLLLSDGGSVTETTTAVDAPDDFHYRLTNFTGLFGRLVAGAESDWRFTADGEHTAVHWTYAFTARPGRGPIVALIMRLFWAPYMKWVLPAQADEVARLLAEDAATPRPRARAR